MQRPPVRERAVLGLYSLAGATAGAALALRKAGASGAAAVALWLATTAALAHSFIAAVVTPSLLLSAGLRVSAPPPPPRPHLLPNTLLSELTRRQPPPPQSLGCGPSGSKTPAGAPARVAELEADNAELRAAANASAIAAAVATRERNDAEAAAARKDVLLQQLLALNEAAAAQLQVLAAEQPALAACAASERAACKVCLSPLTPPPQTSSMSPVFCLGNVLAAFIIDPWCLHDVCGHGNDNM